MSAIPAAGVGGSSILGSIIKAAVPALISGVFGGGDTPKPPEVKDTEAKPEDALRAEEERLRALKRRRQSGTSSGLLNQGTSITVGKSLLGE